CRRPRQALRLDSELRLHRYRFVPGRDAGTMTFTVGYDDALLFDDKHPWDDAQRQLMDAGFGDGLPVVVPTAARMEGMLRGMASHSVGQMPPLFGELTPEAVAYCCVLAGCVPAELPVVLAAAAATLKDEFNLLGLQTTTGSPTVCVMVHGPIARQLGMNAEANCLGPGNRANACIGRALQLVLRNIGGARPGTTDMATIGQPGKYVFCLAEGEHPLLPSLAQRRGIRGASAVSVLGISGTLEVLPTDPGTDAESLLAAVADAMHGARVGGAAGRETECGEQFLLVPPEIADRIQEAGWTLPDAQRFLWERSPPGRSGKPWPLARNAESIHCIAAGGSGIKTCALIPWGGGSESVTLEVG